MPVDLLPLLGNIDKSPAAARAAMQAAEAYSQRARGKWGNPDPMLEEEQHASDASSIHVFSVGPWNQWARLGSWGDFFLPAKPENQRYSYCCTIPGIYLEHMLNGEGDVTSKHIKGLLVAQNIVGEGDLLRGNGAGENRARDGVFIGSVRGPQGRTPTEADIVRAEGRLQARLQELVSEANEAAAMGGGESFLRINEKHHTAAKMIGRKDLKWMQDRNPEISNPCPECGRGAPDTATRCQCGFILKPAEFWAKVLAGAIVMPGVEVPAMYRTNNAVFVPEPAVTSGPVVPPVASPAKEKIKNSF
jgi:hypothetical protein